VNPFHGKFFAEYEKSPVTQPRTTRFASITNVIVNVRQIAGGESEFRTLPSLHDSIIPLYHGRHDAPE
jgi:hypothetical protein